MLFYANAIHALHFMLFYANAIYANVIHALLKVFASSCAIFYHIVI
jgi:hypothetical protein